MAIVALTITLGPLVAAISVGAPVQSAHAIVAGIAKAWSLTGVIGLMLAALLLARPRATWFRPALWGFSLPSLLIFSVYLRRALEEHPRKIYDFDLGWKAPFVYSIYIGLFGALVAIFLHALMRRLRR